MNDLTPVIIITCGLILAVVVLTFGFNLQNDFYNALFNNKRKYNEKECKCFCINCQSELHQFCNKLCELHV